jgi:predicted alpha/beta superfamily hydrolase
MKNGDNMSEKYPRRSLYNTEERILSSTNVSRDYHLSISLPEGYSTSAKSYPVLYLLDSDTNFGMAAGSTRFLQFLGKPEVIVVGIGYDMESIDQWVELRERDFKIPEIPSAPADSHADLFLKALFEEIIPFIEANYRTTPGDRCLYGYSSSGFFVLYALFHEPDAFQRYIAGSGDLYLAYPYLIHQDRQLAARKSPGLIHLYLSAGELEEHQFPFFHQLAEFLEQGNYPGLVLTTEIFKGEYHGTVGGVLSYLHGFLSVYPDVSPIGPFALG